MNREIGAGAFKAKCLGLLEDVRQRREVIVITKRGTPIARLVPVDEVAPEVFGRLKGSGKITGDLFSTGEAWDADA